MPFRDPTMYFTESQHVVSDKDCTVQGDQILFPFKFNASSTRKHRTKFNQDIGKQLMCNKWSIGLIKNRFRLLLDNFPFEKSIFESFLTVIALFVNSHIRRQVIATFSHERILDRSEYYYSGKK